jgi:CubicO group peptidase (beta-lactamase class C family)
MLPFAFSAPQVTVATQRLIDAEHGAGAAVGIVHDGQLIYVKTFGDRNIAGAKPVDAQTRFEIGSVTKQFTAAAILQLQEQGKLSIDDRLMKYLPSFPHANELTLRQLLNQISGLPNYTSMPDIMNTMATAPDAEGKITAYVAGPLHFTPGTKWEYSNTNYWVLGQVVATVSGMTWEDYVRANLFARAGMSHSGFISDEPAFDDFATPYWQGLKNDGPLQTAPTMLESWPGGAGAIVSTIGDLAAWDDALAGGRIISHDDFGLMSTPGRLADGKLTNYGMGLELDPHDGHHRIGHSGGTTGSLAMNATYPDDNLDIIVLQNSLSGDPGAIESAVLETIYPDALAAARTPAQGEDLAVRAHIVRLIADHFAAFGAPTAIIFKDRRDAPGGTWYLYRVEFAHGVENFQVQIDKKTGTVAGMSMRPAG